jgi:NarL family two-component system sensor histidine kinase LiaS
MKQMRNPFQGIRWKLTLSYTVVTVATLLVIELLLIGGLYFLLVNSNILPSTLVSAVESFITPQVATFLDNPQPDLGAMTAWLQSAFEEGLTFRSAENPSVTFHLGDLDQNATLIVLDSNLDRLTSIPTLNGSVTDKITQSATELLIAAQRGESDHERISQIADGKLTAAVPVIDDGGKVIGIVVMVITYPPPGSLIETLSLVGVSLVIFTIAAGIVGTIFGYLTARGLTKRLRSVSLASTSWSQGDFSAFIQDRSGDELGQLAQQLNLMAEQLQNLLQTKQELAALEERNRLARDLHDSVKQQVFASTMQVGAARALLDPDNSSALEHLKEAEQLSRQAQTELAMIIRELRPATLEDKSLNFALKEFIAEWSQLNEIPAKFNVAGEGALPQEVEEALFRVTQEALSNIVKHSEATEVDIQLAWEDNEVSITISDNGNGFDINTVEGIGMGLRIMRERMEGIGGRLSIDSNPGEGTQLIARYQISDEVPE